MCLKPIPWIAIVAFLLTGPAGAQTYDPSTGESPLVLLAVPKDGVAYYERKVRAKDLVENEKHVEAEPLVEQLVRDYPCDAENWIWLGLVKWGLKKYIEAAAASERCLFRRRPREMKRVPLKPWENRKARPSIRRKCGGGRTC